MTIWRISVWVGSRARARDLTTFKKLSNLRGGVHGRARGNYPEHCHLCNMDPFTDEFWMKKALDEAKAAFEEDEIPIGAVVVAENRIVGKGHNQTERLTDVTAHAEMLAITAAASALNSKYLDECTLYVTLEPCLMCAGAIRWARFHRVVFGAKEPKFGYSNTDPNLFGKKTEVVYGLLEADCANLMKQFFQKKR